MGLTIHYKLKHTGTDKTARTLIERCIKPLKTCRSKKCRTSWI